MSSKKCFIRIFFISCLPVLFITGCNMPLITNRINTPKSTGNLMNTIEPSHNEDKQENNKTAGEDNINNQGNLDPIDLFPVDDISDKVKSELDQLIKVENDHGETYLRKRAEIITETPSSERITLDAVRTIIREASSYESIVNEIEKIHGFPDAQAGSGIERLEYWLDENGNEKIVTWLYRIYYVVHDDFDHGELLYHPDH